MDNKCGSIDELDVLAAVNRLYAHDFNNAVSAISANLSYMELVAPELDRDFQRSIEDCNLAVKLLSRMFDNFVTISRLEAGQGVEVVELALGQFFESSLRRGRELLGQSGVSIATQGEVPEAACEWELKYAELALDNLMMVSVQGSRPNSEVVLEVSVLDDFALFRVTDGGVAVARERREGLFTRDGQLRAKSDPGSLYGRAMGLYAVGLVADRMGGSITAGETDSRNRFLLTLPLRG